MRSARRTDRAPERRVNYSGNRCPRRRPPGPRSRRRAAIPQHEAVTREPDASVLRDLDLEAHLRDPSRKQRFVTPMFDVIAPRYDDFTRIFSFGMDRGWKRELLALLEGRIPRGAVVLDLACGTGDLALGTAALARSGDGTTFGLDASSRMIVHAEARRRADGDGSRVRFTVGDIARLPFADRSVDVVTAGYALRNVPVCGDAIREIRRVLKPGGALVTLDFYRPESPVWRTLLLGYLAAAGRLVGWWWHRAPVVYGYIARSIDHFCSWQAFARLLAEHGFTVRTVRRKLLGGVAIHAAVLDR